MLISVKTTEFEPTTDYSMNGFVSVKYKEINDEYYIKSADINFIRERSHEDGSVFTLGFCGEEIRITKDEAVRILGLLEEEENI